ncbi:hypothetical protein FHS55_000029 [Angulomicrobium tetraedrale]|uniref:Uncharacterized protein n=1 Tax=Ancylobacter tetraedralis TaxID=217068 RepID=A0A839Z399_9HYPH|nr:hypothetical protein [Ancylobacter tetraedralis]MBB3769443.1 hypothetical protein [Ancylobacter tetraedralis]
MCETCDGLEATPRGFSPERIAAARAAEMRRPGEAIPEEAWLIFAGKRGGSLAFAHYRRILESLVLAAGQPASTFRCD